MKTAMILAAGRGERLKPLTNQRPKALCTVHGKALIEYHVENLAKVGFEHIVINHAYLGGQIRRHLGDGRQWGINICYAPEPPGGLETGGGIYNALPLLGNEPFATVNADIFTDYDFSQLRLAAETMIHLILVNNPQHNRFGDFGLINQKFLSRDEKQYTFAGIAAYRPDLFKTYTAGRYSIVQLIVDNINNQLAQGELYEGQWLDIGSAERLQFANSLNPAEL